MDYVISAENISKRYFIGARGNLAYRTLRESIVEAVGASWKKIRSRVQPLGKGETTEDTLWALKDVSFKVSPGEIVGIIGRNGAGKSTLLKILSRITEPSSGRVSYRGKLSSLLEVGTGFHPELTGRENVYLNGSIMGMKRSVITRIMNRIVEFSEISRFIDIPVKRYSSGMYTRLAFAVAAHMDPDILLIDEVLSVGDLAFQQKCLQHIQSLKHSGTTIIIVSHNMFTIKSMCDRSICLSGGRILFDGPTEVAVNHYDSGSRMYMSEWAHNLVGSDPTKCPISISNIDICDINGCDRVLFEYGERARIRLHFEARETVVNPNFCVSIIRSDGIACCNFNTMMDGFPIDKVSGSGTLDLLTPPICLVSELYTIHVLVWDSCFQRLLCAQVGKDFHVRHPVLSIQFGVFHEAAEWEWSGARHTL
jgi:lipopolysaccharide transport system ATP-binding protein